MIKSKELLWEPRSWACTTVDPPMQISIDAVEGPLGTRYAVRKAGLCLSKASLRFDYEPLSSSRSEEWLDDHRVVSLLAAQELFSAWVSSAEGKDLKRSLFRRMPLVGAING